MSDVNDILEFIRTGGNADRFQIETLLNAEGRDRELLYANAREVRDKQFGDKIFAYGFIYFSTYCHNNCTFCYYRCTNQIDRYRKTPEEITDLAMDLKEEGIDLVDLTMGEDERMYADGCSELIDIVSRVHELGINIMVSPGAVKHEVFPKLKAAGADFFAVYQETHNREGYARLRLKQDYDFRYNQRDWAHDAGMLAEDGLLVGAGESVSDIAESIIEMGKQGCEQIRAMTFVPQAGTPLMNFPATSSDRELKAIAVMRLLYPEKFIPATLDVEGIDGMKARLDAGASTITSIIVPRRHLAGVAQPKKDIESGARSMQHISDLVGQMGKKIATQAEFASLMISLEARLAKKRPTR